MKITARALILNADHQMLLVRHHGSPFWSLPGGKMEWGEDLKSGLFREIFEELGVGCRIGNLQYVHEFRYSAESDVTMEFFFSVILENENITAKTTELQDIEWISITLETFIKPEFLKTYCSENLASATPEYISYI